MKFVPKVLSTQPLKQSSKLQPQKLQRRNSRLDFTPKKSACILYLRLISLNIVKPQNINDIYNTDPGTDEHRININIGARISDLNEPERLKFKTLHLKDEK